MQIELFSRNFSGDIIVWSIEANYDNNSAIVKHGRFGGKLISTVIYHNNINSECISRVNKKYKEGYKPWDKVDPNSIPIIKYDDNWNTKPMKCQPFKEHKFIYPAFAQPKLNGLRCTLRWENIIEGEGLFTTTNKRAVLRTKEGLEYVLPHITLGLTEEHFIYQDDILTFDGELYIHKKPLNYIKSSCPMTNSKGTISKASNSPLEVRFHIFDLAIPSILQKDRLEILQYLNSSTRHYNNTSIFTDSILRVESIIINSDSDAINYRNNCISAGYEGCVLRSMFEEYAFGHRPSYIMKFKDHMDGEFLIIDIIPQETDSNKGQFVLQNDINNETFKSMPSGKEFGTHLAQQDLLTYRDSYIGKYATVRYRERSGVKSVPFHQNVIGIRIKPSSDLLIN